MAIDEIGPRIPDEAAIFTASQAIIKELRVGQVIPKPQNDTPSTIRIDGKCYKRAGFVPKRQIASIDEEVVHLNTLVQSIGQFRAACALSQRDCDEKLSRLSIWNPGTWSELFCETLDQLIIGLFQEPLISFGTIRVKAFRVNESLKRVDEEIRILKESTLPALQPILEVKALEAYQLLGRLAPHDKTHLAGFAEKLLINGAYAQAADALRELIGEDPQNSAAHRVRFAAALKCAKHFEEAQKALEGLRPQDTENMRIDCLIGRGLYSEAKQALLQQEPKTLGTTKKLFFLTVREELAKEKKRSFDACKLIFSQIEPELSLQGKIDEAAVSFWMACFATQPLLYQNKKLADEVMKQLLVSIKKLNNDAKGAFLGKAIASLKADVTRLSNYAKNTAFDSLSDGPLKEGLIQARKETIKEQADGNGSTCGTTQRKEFLLSLVAKAKLAEAQKADFEKELQALVVEL